MSVTKLNEDYLFYQKGDCYKRGVFGSKSQASKEINAGKFQEKATVNHLGYYNNTVKPEVNNNKNISKNYNNLSKNKTQKNFPVEKIDFFQNGSKKEFQVPSHLDFSNDNNLDSLSNMDNRHMYNFYGNIENLIMEEDNACSQISLNQKNFNLQFHENDYNNDSSIINEDKLPDATSNYNVSTFSGIASEFHVTNSDENYHDRQKEKDQDSNLCYRNNNKLNENSQNFNNGQKNISNNKNSYGKANSNNNNNNAFYNFNSDKNNSNNYNNNNKSCKTLKNNSEKNLHTLNNNPSETERDCDSSFCDGNFNRESERLSNNFMQNKSYANSKSNSSSNVNSEVFNDNYLMYKNLNCKSNNSNKTYNSYGNSINTSKSNGNSGINIKSNCKNFDFPYEKKAGKWSEEEDRILYELVPLYGAKNWRKISDNIKGRTPIQCLHRWTKILQPGLVKGPWTIEEDRKLLEWVRKEGPTKWTQCSEFIKGRNGKQCRERWLHTLNPKVIKGNWTSEEDLRIFTLYNKLGGKWSKIAVHIPGRTENSIKNRFYSTLRRKAVENSKLSQHQSSSSTLNSGQNSLIQNKMESHSQSQIEANNNTNFQYARNQNNNFNISNSISNMALEDLIEFLPQALLEVRLKYAKDNNFTGETLARKENEILNDEFLREKKSNIEYLKEKILNEEKKSSTNFNNNNNSNNASANHIPSQTINVNLNFNSHLNNYIVGGDKVDNSQVISPSGGYCRPNANLQLSESNGCNGSNINNSNNTNTNLFSNRNNMTFKDDLFPVAANQGNLNSNNFKLDFSHNANEYKNLDLFSLENNIIDMCDNPSFMFPDHSFNFLDSHVDNIIDNIFLNNNIILTNDQEKDCNFCLLNNHNQKHSGCDRTVYRENTIQNQANDNFCNMVIDQNSTLNVKAKENISGIDPVKNNSINIIKIEPRISRSESSTDNTDVSNSNSIFSDNNNNRNFIIKNTENNPKDSTLVSFATSNDINELDKEDCQIIYKQDDDSTNNGEKKKNKKIILSSLISQLEDLEKLVKNTKKELLKFNEKESVNNEKCDEAILNTMNLSDTIQKLLN